MRKMRQRKLRQMKKINLVILAAILSIIGSIFIGRSLIVAQEADEVNFVLDKKGYNLYADELTDESAAAYLNLIRSSEYKRSGP